MLKTGTGIPGLDEKLLRGLPKGQAIILSGPPGSGKSTFGMQFLYRGIEYGENGVYVALSQSRDGIRTNMKSYGWDMVKRESEGRLLLIDARPFRISEEGVVSPNESLYRGEALPFSHLTDMMLAALRKINAKRLVIDSITVLAMQYSNKFYIRQGMLAMIQALSDIDCTSVIISESIPEDGKHPTEWYIAHGVLLLHYVRKADTMERALQIVKMRGTKHGEQIYPIKISDEGLSVLEPKVMT